MNIAARWLGFMLCEVVFLVCLFTNVATIVRYVWSKKHGSQIPVVGGISGAIGLSVSPAEWLSALWWLPLVMDPGCAFLGLSILVFQARRVRQSR